MVDYTAAPVTIFFIAQYVLDFLSVVENRFGGSSSRTR
jgi:hypothetical protein